MHRHTHLFILTLGLLAVFPLSSHAQSPEPAATIRVNLKAEKAPVSPNLHGIFMEEISHAFDGGIYAELIQNRSFEEGVVPPGMKLVEKPDGGLKMELKSLPPGVPTNQWDMPWPWNGNCGWDTNRALIGWSLENRGGAKGEMQLTEANPMNAASSRSLAMHITPGDNSAGRVALINSGYWGINAQSGVAYDLKFYLRPGTFTGQVTASLESSDGKILASRDLGQIKAGTTWEKHTAKLKATGTDPQARFVLSFRGQGDLQVDWVSLFPPTFKNRPNGLRPELAKYLQDLKPAFIRYPGGCYVEGLSWESAPDWRTMVCPPEERPGQWGYWQYRSTDGFGYHEFLQFCEDIGSDAMYVSFAGMTVHPENNWPLDKIAPVVQRTLDAIEYAIGPVNSKWGARRAAMGHPKPFPLKYVEIGNEHPPAIYGDYYKKFRDAIKAKYPDITVVMSMFWSGLNQAAIARAGDQNIDMVDEHAYRDASWIRSNFGYFDKYPRKPWSIYVGEYASHHGGGDWYGGMGDSLYLMMCERNGDLVKLASYAPLFCNVNKRDWGINLIEFDSSRSFAHASYYVQKVFAENRPDVNLATTVALQSTEASRPLLAGRFGLCAWSTLNEFKDLRIYDEKGNLVCSDDFQTLTNWDTPGTGTWRVENGVLQQTDPGVAPAMLFLKNFRFATGRVTIKARRVSGAEGFQLLFGTDRPERGLDCNYGGWGNTRSAMEVVSAQGISARVDGELQGALENNRWYDLSLVLTKDSAEMFLDGKRVSRVTAEFLREFFATAGYDRKNKTVVVKATSYSSKPLRAEIQLDGAARVGRSGRQIVISAPQQFDENSLENPRLIVPRELPLSDVSERFSVELPPYSVNVLRLPARPK
ncbi:MAG TPA: alpha-L-arabinofuranosidase C-terminal domain-containing protein [Verrucomicrobiae bacterium]|nr:alpha-L-arabinofuranosidase C-terminal domain-containing protein [Verrucomicrobiae bacterium]